jgi:hypothetical protein
MKKKQHYLALRSDNSLVGNLVFYEKALILHKC